MPPEMFALAKRAKLVKAVDLEKPSPTGFKSWWFIRLTTESYYLPPNIKQYGQPQMATRPKSAPSRS